MNKDQAFEFSNKLLVAFATHKEYFIKHIHEWCGDDADNIVIIQMTSIPKKDEEEDKEKPIVGALWQAFEYYGIKHAKVVVIDEGDELPTQSPIFYVDIMPCKEAVEKSIIKDLEDKVKYSTWVLHIPYSEGGFCDFRFDIPRPKK